MRATVLSVGSELLRGDIVDTNAAYLGRRLSRLGFEVARVQAVGDALGDLRSSLEESLLLAQVVITTGGLGPTEDDLTREAIAAALGEEPRVDDSLLAVLEARFSALGRRTIPASNRKQAWLIPSAQSIPNPNGTAPGWLVRVGDKYIVAMPGPPREMYPMWEKQVEPILEPLIPEARAAATLMTFGVGESMLERQIVDIIHRDARVTVATYAKTEGVEVHVTSRAGNKSDARRLCEETEAALRETLGAAVFGVSGDTLASAVGRIVRDRGLTVGVMESCTGGELASLLTNVDGSSEYFVGGIVAYSRLVKEQYGVSPEVIETSGIVSAEASIAMAHAARKTMGSDIGLGTTGVAGKSAANGHPAGTCFVAVTMDGVTEAREIHRPGERDIVKRFFSQCALDLLRRRLLAL